jgi:multidrug efflux pump subunit AcrA (membrane-fusion protein)
VKNALVVPTEAVLRTGERSVVILSQSEGRFLPREVTTGFSQGGLTQILEGIGEGDEVVTSSQFLLDSESKLQEAIQKMIAGSGQAGSGG